MAQICRVFSNVKRIGRKGSNYIVRNFPQSGIIPTGRNHNCGHHMWFSIYKGLWDKEVVDPTRWNCQVLKADGHLRIVFLANADVHESNWPRIRLKVDGSDGLK